MPTPEALAALNRAAERMRQAQEELLAYIERPDREVFSPADRAEHQRLLDNVNRSIAEYWEAFNRAAQS